MGLHPYTVWLVDACACDVNRLVAALTPYVQHWRTTMLSAVGLGGGSLNHNASPTSISNLSQLPGLLNGEMSTGFASQELPC